MTSQPEVHVAEVIDSHAAPLSVFDGLNALNQLVAAAQDCIKVHAVENTKQARISAYAKTEIKRIKASEDILKAYFEQTFAERRSAFDGLFERLDVALGQGDAPAIGTVLQGIVDIARSSPIADLDLSGIRAALSDPEQVWDL